MFYSLPSLCTQSFEGHKSTRISATKEAGRQMQYWQCQSLGATWMMQLCFKLGVIKKEKHDKVRVHDWIIQNKKGQCNSLTEAISAHNMVALTLSMHVTVEKIGDKLEIWISCKSQRDKLHVECVHEPLCKLNHIFQELLFFTQDDCSRTGKADLASKHFFSFYIFQVHRVLNWKLQSCYSYKP